jgi:hypothetical protein
MTDRSPTLGGLARQVLTWCVPAVVAALASGPARGQERPHVTHITPPVLQAARTQEVTLHGRHLQAVTGLLADVPLSATCLERTPTRARFRVTPPREAWLGLHQARAYTADSVSAPRLFLLDELPVVRQRGGNHSPADAQRLSLPASVAGRTRPGKEDYYRFRQAAPAALTFEVVAERLGVGPEVNLGGDETGRLVTIDPVLRLLDASGRELAAWDDTPGLTFDVRGRYRFDRAGDYFVAVHDVQFHGGAEHQYVLRVGDFPDVAACYPAGGPAEPIRTALRFASAFPSRAWERGALGPGASPAEIYTSSQDLDGVRWVSAVAAGTGLRSLALPHLVGRAPEVTEVEPNDAPTSAMRISLPVICNGRLGAPGDVDSYALDLRKGQQVQVSVFARAVGSAVWPAVRVAGADGKTVVATAEDGSPVPNGSATDPRLDPPPLVFTAAADGRHVVQVERRLGKTGPAAVYRLEIEPFAGAFTLQPAGDFVAVPRGGTAALVLEIQRDRLGGPLDLAVEGAAPGLRTRGQRPPNAQARRCVVTLSAPAGAAPTAGWFTVTGRAKAGDRQVVRAADLTALYDAPAGLRPNQGHFFFLRPVPWVVRHRIPFLVTDPAPFTLAWGEKRVTARAGSTAAVTVRCRRSGGFDGPVSLRLEGLPEKSTAEAPAIARGAGQAQVTLKLAKDLAPGRYSLALVGEASPAGRKRTNATPLLTLEVQ